MFLSMFSLKNERFLNNYDTMALNLFSNPQNSTYRSKCRNGKERPILWSLFNVSSDALTFRLLVTLFVGRNDLIVVRYYLNRWQHICVPILVLFSEVFKKLNRKEYKKIN